jgi:hypothetical protein
MRLETEENHEKCSLRYSTSQQKVWGLRFPRLCNYRWRSSEFFLAVCQLFGGTHCFHHHGTSQKTAIYTNNYFLAGIRSRNVETGGRLLNNHLSYDYNSEPLLYLIGPCYCMQSCKGICAHSATSLSPLKDGTVCRSSAGVTMNVSDDYTLEVECHASMHCTTQSNRRSSTEDINCT